MRNLHATLPAGILAAAACAGLLSGCILDRTAGGTGVGNPAKGSVTVALMASDSAPGTAKSAAAPLAKAASDGQAGAPVGPAAAGPIGPGAAKTAAPARNPDGSFDIRDAGGTVFTVRTGYANVGRIRIALPDGVGCSEADGTVCEAGEVRIEGPWVSDLMTGKWIPAPDSVRIPVGIYKRLEVRLEAQEKAGAGAPDLGRHSLVFAGTFAWSGRNDRPFSVALDFDEDERFESPAGFPVAAGENAITIGLDIAQWMTHADLTACLENGSLPLDSAGGFALGKDGGCDVGQELKDAIKASGSVRGGHLDGSR